MKRAGRTLAAATGLVIALAMSGCTAMSGVQSQARAGDEKGYIAGSGAVSELAPAERGEPIEAGGETTDGTRLELADLRGDVAVLNLWYASCAPCRKEAPDLAAISAEKASAGVRFVGLNTIDSMEVAQAFEETFGIDYPTILDDDSQVVLALRGQLVPNAVPTTLVIDRDGRVAARISGQADPEVLRALIDDVLAEAV